MDFEPDPQSHGPGPDRTGGATTVYMVSIFLLLIALFAILHTVSRKEDTRAAAVADSLRATFQRSGGPGGKERAETFRFSGLSPEFRETVIQLFGSFVDRARFSHVEDANMLRIAVEPGEIFHTGTATLRADRLALVQRLAEMIAGSHSGMHSRIDIWLQRPAGSGDAAGRTLTVHRAGVLARDLVRQQVAPKCIGIGVGKGKGERILFVFTAIAASDNADD